MVDCFAPKITPVRVEPTLEIDIGSQGLIVGSTSNISKDHALGSFEIFYFIRYFRSFGSFISIVDILINFSGVSRYASLSMYLSMYFIV